MELAAVALLLAGCGVPVRAQDPKQIIETLIAHEDGASAHRGRYVYWSEERSERTGGHLWTERVAETAWGKVRLLVKEDGQPLSPARTAAERGRLAGDAADPEGFKKRESARGEDEQHARAMLQLLPRAFLFDPPKTDAGGILIFYHPNPKFVPGSLEERVLHGMDGSVLIDAKAFRTRRIEGRLPQDITIGFGFLATIKAGSNFSTTRMPEDGEDWKTETVHTDFLGKAMFLKNVARKQDAKRWDYRRIPDGTTVADAVKLAEE